MGWADLEPGNLLRVEWKGEGSHLCRLRRVEEGGSWYVLSADNRFRGEHPFDPSLDTWEKVRQTCTKDKLAAPCPECRRRGKRNECIFKSGDHAPPNWRPLHNLENGDAAPKEDTKSREVQQQPERKSKTGRPLKFAAEAEGTIADLKKRLASAQSLLRKSKRKIAALELNASTLRKKTGELKKKLRQMSHGL